MPAAFTVPGQVRKVAVLRANGLGDLMFVLPALGALRGAYPDAEFVLLAAGWQDRFLRGRGVVDRVVEVPPFEGVRSGPVDTAVQERFFECMREKRFDMALQMHGGGRNSNPFVLRLGATFTAGFRTPDAPPLDLSLPHVYLHHEVLRYLELAEALGATITDGEPRLPVLTEDRAEAATLLAGIDHPVVVLNPGASDPRRRWDATKFAATGDALAKAGASIVISGAAADAALAARIEEQMRAPCHSVAGKLSLGGLAGLMGAADLVVSNDTGPLHVAAAVGTRTVGIYWGPNLINAGPVGSARHLTLPSWQMACPHCGRTGFEPVCGHSVSLVDAVSVEDVVEAALLQLRSAHPAKRE